MVDEKQRSHVPEVMVRPSSAGPEWIELHNPNDFAIALKVGR